jgi:hypothetical protein
MMKLAYGAKVVRYMQRTGIEPRDDEELRQVIEQGFAAELQRVFYAADLRNPNVYHAISHLTLQHEGDEVYYLE